MKIKSLKYHDKSRNWKLETTTFGNLTLLVGASGVGKTQILRSIQNIKRIANGASLSGVEWHIEFQASDSEKFVWQGEFENYEYREENIVAEFGLIEKNGNKYKPKIVWEKLIENETLIVERNEQNIFFKGKKTVKLHQEESVVYLLREEEEIYVIEQAFELVVLVDYISTQVVSNYYSSMARGKYLSERYSVGGNFIELNNSIELIRSSGEPIRHQLFLCSKVNPQIFAEIKEHFMNIFPFVEDMRIKTIENESFPDMFRCAIQIREKGVKDWIDEDHISAGMQRTLLQISDLYLCEDGSVFLIDEFENSLGINCIDDLTSILLNHKRDLQFILTSHHPYIINKISYDNWKIVTRQGGVVKTHDANDFNLGKSKHEAFTQLINLDEYTEGIEV